jgi:hypothetical protein
MHLQFRSQLAFLSDMGFFLPGNGAVLMSASTLIVDNAAFSGMIGI